MSTGAWVIVAAFIAFFPTAIYLARQDARKQSARRNGGA